MRTSKKTPAKKPAPTLPQDLLSLARAAQRNSYSPYSQRRIGAAVRWSDGKITNASNVENASYGATVCAERIAIWKGLSENPKRRIHEILVVSDLPEAWPPCGLCRQVTAEFCLESTLVYVANKSGVGRSFLFSELQPEAFTPKFLNAKARGT